jgi:catecholate siderophore receptor
MQANTQPSAFAAVFLLGIGLSPLLAYAEATVVRLQFAQPAQDLPAALRAVAARFGSHILFAEEDVRGKSGPALQGAYSAEEAYAALLKGTSLIADLSEQGIVVIRPHQPPQQTRSAPEPSVTSPETVVVTGRAGVETLTRAETSYSMDVVPQERLRETGVSSVADSIRTTPGFWVEDSGGEASANVRARGIPVDGFASIQLAEDGMPIQHDPALGYLNADQSFRLDETIDQVQIVRGGPSSVLASNAPGGLVNYIIRKPGPEFQGVTKLTLGDDGLYRTDLWVGGPLGAGWGGAFGGFYRTERGVRDPGYPFNDGGQFRVSLSHDLGRGRFDFDYKHMDDHVGFYTDIPLLAKGETIAGVPGLNANTGILNGPETENLLVRTPGGPTSFDTSDGTAVVLDQFTATVAQEFGEWHVEDHVRLRSTDQQRLGLFPVSVQTGAQRLSQLLPEVQAVWPKAASLQFRYVDSPDRVFGAAQNGNGLEIDEAARHVSLNERELMSDFRASRKFNIAAQSHDVSVGLYIMSGHEHIQNYSAVALMDVENHARLLNVVALDSSGAVLGTVTENGFIRYGAEFADGQGEQLSRALYVTDEWQVTRALRIDLGARGESMVTSGTSEDTATVSLDQTATLADKSYLTGSGVFAPFGHTFFAINGTAAANWQFDAAQGAFLRATAAARLPSISNYFTSPDSEPVIDRTQMYELGYKLSRRCVDLYATLFDTEYHDYGVAETVYDNATQGITTQTYYGDTRDYGIELDGALRPVTPLEVSFAATLQEPKYSSLKYSDLSGNSLVPVDYDGNQLLRIPKLSVDLGAAVYFYDERVRAEVSMEYYSARYADAANSESLPAYAVLGANIRYRLQPDLTLYLSGSNLTNTIGLTEGNPRSGEILASQAGAAVFLGRPILGRTIRMSLLWAL